MTRQRISRRLVSTRLRSVPSLIIVPTNHEHIHLCSWCNAPFACTALGCADKKYVGYCGSRECFQRVLSRWRINTGAGERAWASRHKKGGE